MVRLVLRKGTPPALARRPECGNDAMLWKERHFASTDLFTKLVVLPATIVLTVIVLLQGELDEKLVTILHVGLAVRLHSSRHGSDRIESMAYQYIPDVYGLWLLAVAGASASAVTLEREHDTWDSLIATRLSGWEIIRGKVVGAIWGLRGFGGLLSLFWLVGLAAGAVHPLGLVLALLIVAVLTWFVASLGFMRPWSRGRPLER